MGEREKFGKDYVEKELWKRAGDEVVSKVFQEIVKAGSIRLRRFMK